MSVTVFHEDTCVICGKSIPESRMVCPMCEMNIGENAARKKPARKQTGFPILPVFEKRRQSTGMPKR